jgi:dTDP-4-dehydrorhamnose 3,5-epimerase
MKISPTALPEVVLIEPDVYSDARGEFFESFSAKRYAALGLPSSFVQDNVSYSMRHTLRGLHLQSPPHGQGKLVFVHEGAVLDVVVDVRTDSPTFGQWSATELSSSNHRQLYIPAGFAHGFCVTSERAIFAYKCTHPYVREAELSIAWNDPALGISWPTDAPLLSAKDADAPRLRDLERKRLPTQGGGP